MYNDVEEELLISINELEFKDENVYLVSMNYLFNYVETMYSLFTKLDEAIEFTIHRFAEFSSIYEKKWNIIYECDHCYEYVIDEVKKLFDELIALKKTILGSF